MADILSGGYGLLNFGLKETVIAVAAVICVYLFYVLRVERGKLLIDCIPGYKDWPIIGDILHLKRDPTGMSNFCFQH